MREDSQWLFSLPFMVTQLPSSFYVHSLSLSQTAFVSEYIIQKSLAVFASRSATEEALAAASSLELAKAFWLDFCKWINAAKVKCCQCCLLFSFFLVLQLKSTLRSVCLVFSFIFFLFLNFNHFVFKTLIWPFFFQFLLLGIEDSLVNCLLCGWFVGFSGYFHINSFSAFLVFVFEIICILWIHTTEFILFGFLWTLPGKYNFPSFGSFYSSQISIISMFMFITYSRKKKKKKKISVVHYWIKFLFTRKTRKWLLVS